MQLFEVHMTTEASAVLKIVAPDGDVEEAMRIAQENAPQAGAFDDYEFGDEWDIESVRAADDQDDEPSSNVYQEYDMDDDNDDNDDNDD